MNQQEQHQQQTGDGRSNAQADGIEDQHQSRTHGLVAKELMLSSASTATRGSCHHQPIVRAAGYS
jgi:hypothetical protein